MVQVDCLDESVDGACVRRVDADEEPLEELAVGDGVAARVALDSVVGADDDDRRVLVRSRHGIPGGRERRIERVAVPSRLDSPRCASLLPRVERAAQRVPPLHERRGRIRVSAVDADAESLARRGPACDAERRLVRARRVDPEGDEDE